MSSASVGHQKAILVEFDCVNRPFDATDAGLIEFVIATDETLAIRIVDQFSLLTSELGLGERSLIAYLMGYLRQPESLVEALSEVPASIRPSDDDYLSTMETLRNLVKQARESGSYKHQFHEDFSIAASDWINRGFKCVVYSEYHDRDAILDILERTGLKGDIIAVKVPRKENKEGIKGLSEDLGLDLRSSFLIAANLHGAREVRNRYSIKTAVLDRIYVGKPYEERGYYLNIGSLLEIDPEPTGVDIRTEVTDETSLSDFLKPRKSTKRLIS